MQAIENAYLMTLDAKHAKESHLKAVKRLQMLRALRCIQRFWKSKYSDLKKASQRLDQATYIGEIDLPWKHCFMEEGAKNQW